MHLLPFAYLAYRERVRVDISSEAADFVRARGGRLWVWAAYARMCCSGSPAWMHAATAPPSDLPRGLEDFAAISAGGAAADDVQIFFRPLHGAAPDILEIAMHGRRNPKVQAYWDGCLMAMA